MESEWLKQNVSEKTIKALFEFEEHMALVARNEAGLVCSHTVGTRSISDKDILSKTDEAFNELTWTNTCPDDSEFNRFSNQYIEDALERLAGMNDFLSIIEDPRDFRPEKHVVTPGVR